MVKERHVSQSKSLTFLITLTCILGFDIQCYKEVWMFFGVSFVAMIIKTKTLIAESFWPGSLFAGSNFQRFFQDFYMVFSWYFTDFYKKFFYISRFFSHFQFFTIQGFSWFFTSFLHLYGSITNLHLNREP